MFKVIQSRAEDFKLGYLGINKEGQWGAYNENAFMLTRPDRLYSYTTDPKLFESSKDIDLLVEQIN
jgi:hypothetical protein